MAIEYDDFEVELSHCICGESEVRVLKSPIDRPRERFGVGVDFDQITSLVKDYDQLVLDPSKRMKRDRLAREIGILLHQALFPGRLGRTLASSLAALETQRDTQKGLRIRISFGDSKKYDPRVGGLPWELLCDPQGNTFLGEDPQSPIVRYLDLSNVALPLTVGSKVKVLGVLSSPTGQHPIDLDTQRKVFRKAVRRQKWLTSEVLRSPASLSALQRKLDRAQQKGRPFHVLHFLGHGGLPNDRDGALCFENEDGTEQLVTGQQLAGQLAGFDLRLVVLASCETAQMPRQKGLSPFTGVASALIAGRIPAVVAMQFAVTERAAAAFTTGFYEVLGECRPVDEAFVAGRRRIQSENVEGFEWATPVLFLRAPDGKILDIETAGAPRKTVAIFNIEDYGKEDIEAPDHPIDLFDYFERRFLKEEHLWSTVLEEIQSVIPAELREDVKYRLTMACPISVALAAGYMWNSKSGFDLTITQRGQHGTEDWRLEGQAAADAPGWVVAPEAQAMVPDDLPLSPDSTDIAVVVSVTRPALPAVGAYLARKELAPPKVGHILHACFESVGSAAICDGAHAASLIAQLIERIDAYAAAHGRGRLHVFFAGPNALAFGLGMQLRLHARIQLYEHDFEDLRHGSYEPSIELDAAQLHPDG